MFPFHVKSKSLRAFRKDERGAVLVLVVLSIAAIMGFVALVLDVGLMQTTRRELQNGVDAAALAGAWELPEDPAAAVSQAYAYAESNGIPAAEVTSATVLRIFQDDQDDAIEVKAERTLNLWFMRVLGIPTTTVAAKATALVTPIKPSDLWPWGVPQSQVGEGYSVMKLGSADGGKGNFWPLDFPPKGGGAKEYSENIKHGWDDPEGLMPEYSSGEPYSWDVDPKTGVVGSTKDAVEYVLEMSALYDPPSCLLADPYSYDPDSPPDGFKPHMSCWRIGYVPIVSDASWEAAKGTKEPVEVIAFAAFYLVSFTPGPPGKAEVHGVWLQNAKAIGKGMVGGKLEGTIGARLWR